ncbi:hypothetical protein GCM10010400_01380 [Streptomyces aculeolatus]|uniref:hypothetical protein n=1 Tax=Streptomyces aculeolatus TaxID=270689 RepID=UPI001CEC5FB0|nr:hypothetical protein [Streptomyces aculeolatus]
MITTGGDPSLLRRVNQAAVLRALYAADALTGAGWGEVGVTSMDQVFINNEFYRADFLPCMLGWISLSGSEDLAIIEGKLARGAGLNAGVGFQSSVAGLDGGGENAARILDAIKQGETARNLGAFTEAQRVVAPRPRLTAGELPEAPLGELYETKVATNTPAAHQTDGLPVATERYRISITH